MMSKDKKTVGIVTITGLDNYGNRLQNYALQSLVEKQGYDCRTLVNTTGYSNRYSRLDIVLKKIQTARKMGLKNSLKMMLGRSSTAKTSRVAMFQAFNDEYIAFYSSTISENSIPQDFSNDFVYFLAGSDQIWNPKLNNFSSINLLGFAPPQKRIAVAPSFGVSSVSSAQEALYKKYLQDYRALSVRESAGQEIIESITGRKATLLVDPTLAVTRSEWTNLQKKPAGLKIGKKDYVALFTLGDLPKYINDILENNPAFNNLAVFDILSDEIQEGGIGPSEFLYIIDNAKFVITDSFHGSVFSIIFNKQFYVFDRVGIHNDMNSRIKTLLSTFMIEDRFIGEGGGLSGNKINYTAVNKVISHEEARFKDYLKGALNE